MNHKKEDKVEENNYNPSRTDKATLARVYEYMQEGIDVRSDTYRQFNDRTLVQFLDDSEKRVQGYVPSRESQGKSGDQSNVFIQDTRTKLRVAVASVALEPPQHVLEAVSQDDGGKDMRRAQIIDGLVEQSYQVGNPELESFWDGWEMATKGTVCKYEGYVEGYARLKMIDTFDISTGEITFTEKEVSPAGELIEANVPLTEIFFPNIYADSIQKQPWVIWLRYLDKDAVEAEFGHYSAWKKGFIQGGSKEKYKSESDTFMRRRDDWKRRVEDKEYEVIRYYHKGSDEYIIVINGVLVFEGPMLWRRRNQPLYPIAWAIFEPFSGREFMYGNSLPNSNMDVQDLINAWSNMASDKMFRSLDPAMLADIANKDLLEQENEVAGMEHIYYVNDVSGVKQMPTEGVTGSELAMLKFVMNQMDKQTTDQTQAGAASSSTARAVVLANRAAERLRGIMFMNMASLWQQKIRIRIINIMMHYTLPQVAEIIGEDGASEYEETFRQVIINGATLDSGEKGTLALEFVGDDEDLPTGDALDVDEEFQRLRSGEPFQKIVMTSSYLDNYEYDVVVITKTMKERDRAEALSLIEDKLRVMATFFPEKMAQSRDILFVDTMEAFDDNPDRYEGQLQEAVPVAALNSGQGNAQPQGAGAGVGVDLPGGTSALPTLPV